MDSHICGSLVYYADGRQTGMLLREGSHDS